MSIFSIEGVLKAIGFDPGEFQHAVVFYKAEFEAMKSGLQQAVRHFNGELIAIRKENAELKAQLDIVMVSLRTGFIPPNMEVKPNGHDRTERERIECERDSRDQSNLDLER